MNRQGSIGVRLERGMIGVRGGRTAYRNQQVKGEEVSLIIDAFTPNTLPMARLAEYLRSFAAMLGHEANVHFDRVAPGSSVCRSFVDPPATPKVRERINAVAAGTAPGVAMKAHADINDLLAEDNAIGQVAVNGHNVIQFPGRMRAAQDLIGPVHREAAIEGYIFSIGEKDETINVRLNNRGVEERCVVSVDLARDLSAYLFGGKVRIFGHGIWYRVNGNWEARSFTGKSFMALDETPLQSKVAAIREIYKDRAPAEFMATMLDLRGE